MKNYLDVDDERFNGDWFQEMLILVALEIVGMLMTGNLKYVDVTTFQFRKCKKLPGCQHGDCSKSFECR